MYVYKTQQLQQTIEARGSNKDSAVAQIVENIINQHADLGGSFTERTRSASL